MRRALPSRFRAPLRSPVFWPLAAGIAAFVLTVGLIWYASHPGKPALRIDLELSDEACCTLLVWANGLGPQDVAGQPLKPGTRATYSFPVKTQFLHYLRIAFAGHAAVGDRLRFHRVWTARGDVAIDEISQAEYRQVGVTNGVLRPEREGATVVATSEFPYLETQAGLVTDAGPRRLFFVELGEKPLQAAAGLLVLGIALTVFFAIASVRHLVMALGLLATILVVRWLPSASSVFELRDDVSEAVGNSPYVGVWKLRDRAILEAAALVALVVPAVTAIGYRLVARRRSGRGTTDEPVTASRPQGLRLRYAVALVSAPVAVVGLLGMPDLKARIGEGRTVEYVNEWDDNNFLFWRYLIRRTDLEPMKDFFWPYGFQWIFEVGPPWGPLASYLAFLSFWVWLALGAYWTLARFFGGRSLALRYGGLMAFVLVVVLAGLLPFANRYVGPLGVLLLYGGIEASDRYLSARRVVFASALLELALFEPAQAIYALVPVAFLVLTELVLEVERTRPWVLHWLLRAGATVGLPVLVAVAVYAATGTLRANFDYYREIDALNSSYALPAAITAWIRDPRTLDAFVLWAVPITIALGMLGLLFGRGRPRLAQAVVVAAGLLGLMVMQKQILRPHAAPAIWLTAVFGLALWAVVDTSFHTVRRWMGVAATCGVVLAVVLMSGQLRPGLDELRAGPARAVATADAAITRRGDFTADARAEFASARFDNFGGFEDVVRELRRDSAVAAGGRFWVLGDDLLLATLLDRSWPYYYIDLYDISPIGYQKSLIRRLEEAPPARIVWNFRATEFDGVPHTVRLPLVYAWTVRHFAPVKVEEQFAILRPLRPGEPVHLDWWRERLGPSVDLGHVPEAAKVRGGECESGAECESYLEIEFDDSAPLPPEVVVPISVDGRAFDVRFDTSPESRRYVVRLDRLWFWDSAPDGARRRVATSAVPNASVRVVRRAVDADSLY
jgi:hypothetical protein